MAQLGSPFKNAGSTASVLPEEVGRIEAMGFFHLLTTPCGRIAFVEKFSHQMAGRFHSFCSYFLNGNTEEWRCLVSMVKCLDDAPESPAMKLREALIARVIEVTNSDFRALIFAGLDKELKKRFEVVWPEFQIRIETITVPVVAEATSAETAAQPVLLQVQQPTPPAPVFH